MSAWNKRYDETNHVYGCTRTSLPILGLHVTSWRPCWWNFNKRMLISFYCTWHQHGRYVFVFWISRDWLQTINTEASAIRAETFHTDDVNQPRIQASLPNGSLHTHKKNSFKTTVNSGSTLSAILTQTKMITIILTRSGAE